MFIMKQKKEKAEKTKSAEHFRSSRLIHFIPHHTRNLVHRPFEEHGKWLVSMWPTNLRWIKFSVSMGGGAKNMATASKVPGPPKNVSIPSTLNSEYSVHQLKASPIISEVEFVKKCQIIASDFLKCSCKVMLKENSLFYFIFLHVRFCT